MSVGEILKMLVEYILWTKKNLRRTKLQMELGISGKI